MSTFDGVIREFPGVRVDFFRGIVDDPPLACFLSHIHSDHLAGLDTYKGRPVYCSAATRALLLKLQRCSSRINFPKGLIEKQEITYKDQRRRLKTLPLQTPTEIELGPGNTIRVTLFDANHCPGAVMFLFEGNGKAVLYTGDVRSEPWHVNALARSPCMFEYSCGLKVLDRIYLDTSYTKDIEFPTKAEGLCELIDKLRKYPSDTIFYVSAYTYGYEDVWIALAKALDTQIHVDDYKLNVYRSLQIKMADDQYVHLSPEAPALTGFMCGNSFQRGLLTSDDAVRLHSCEKGTQCSTMQKANVVFIFPIIAHLSRTEDLAEHGIGGGGCDLEHNEELIVSAEDARTLLQSKELSSELNELLPDFLLGAASMQRPVTLNRPALWDEDCEKDLRSALVSFTKASDEFRSKHAEQLLPASIKFPYSRHSSYRESCHLLQVLKPKDVWPCSVDPMRWIKEDISIQGLFGEYCTGSTFEHDAYMEELALRMKAHGIELHSSQQSDAWENSQEITAEQSEPKDVTPIPAPTSPLLIITTQEPEISPRLISTEQRQYATGPQSLNSSLRTESQYRSSTPSKRTYNEFSDDKRAQPSDEERAEGTSHLLDSQASSVSALSLETRRVAFEAMLNTTRGGGWAGLLSTTNNHTHPEHELGEP